jgi:hypothetical protein
MRAVDIPPAIRAQIVAAYTRRIMAEAGREVRRAGPYRPESTQEVRPLMTRREVVAVGVTGGVIVALCALGLWKLADITISVLSNLGAPR